EEGELLAEQVGHRPPLRLVRLRQLRSVHRSRVPGDGDPLRPVVGEQLEEHVRESEQGVRREPLARRQLLGEREVRPIGEVVAVDEEQLALARRGVVELKLLSGERLGRHLCECTSMGRPAIVPFRDEHLEGAARLLEERHARHREVEPLLPAEVDFVAEIEKERDELGGVVALDGDDVVGYLAGRRREDHVGPHVWSFVAGHAVREPELTRDLYTAAAGTWVDAGLTRHFVYVPSRPELIDPWFRLSFGASAALAMQETAPRPSVDGVLVREGTPGDVAAAAQLDRAMQESMIPSPSFSWGPADDEETLLADWADTWDQPEVFRHFVAEREGAVVGHVLLYR